MSGVNSLYSSSSRVTALFSDMDTDTLVKSLCSPQQTKIDTQVRKKQLSQWKGEALKDIAEAVKTFSNTYCSVLGSSSMLKSATYRKYEVSVSNSDAVTVTAGNDAPEGSFNISVERLAGSATATGKTGISAGGELSASNTETLGKLDFATPLAFDADGKISFSINGKRFDFTADTTLQNMISTINSDVDAGVTMKYSRLTDSFTLTSDTSGADSSLTIKNISGNAFGENGAFGIDTGRFTDGAQNAVVVIDGIRVERTENEFEIDGISYSLHDTTESDARVSVSRDFSATVDAVKEFTGAINELIKTIKGYTHAKDESSDYPPLLEEQKKDMTEEQIEKWETKAKSGVLHYDSSLESLITNLKSAFFTAAGGTGKSLSAIGITTASYHSENAGLLEVDETALKAALAKDSDGVMAMFAGGNSNVGLEDQGAVYQVRSYLTSYLNMSGDTVKGIDERMDEIKEDIGSMEDKLADLADKYYAKFAAMETALSQLNSTAGYLSSLFANK